MPCEHIPCREHKNPPVWVRRYPQMGIHVTERAVTRGRSSSLGGRSLMFSTRLAASLVAALAISAVALPGVASANTGSVKCDATGIVFTYNTDFGRDKDVTETV